MDNLNTTLNRAKALRKELHENPELAFMEDHTRAILMSFIKNEAHLTPVDCGQWFYVEIKGTSNSAPIAFRADFDAVAGADGKPGHYCGHDGHAATLAALAMYLSKHQPLNDVFLIFQPAEETGEGAMLCRNLIAKKHIQAIYGYHNIPGREKGSVLIRPGTFACASTGLEITFTGHPSHAAYPEAGKNPALLISKCIIHLNDLISIKHKGMVLGTVIGVDIGSSAYGVSAGQGILRLTLRGEFENEFDELLRSVIQFAEAGARDAGLECSYREIERFAATENHDACNQILIEAAKKVGLKTILLNEPFRWSEDFGYYLCETKGAFFGIGDGEDHPQLHTDNYCYPDDIMESALKMFISLCE